MNQAPCLILLGATGNVMARYVFPALARLKEARRLPDNLSMLAIGKKTRSAENFRALIKKNVKDQSTYAYDTRALNALLEGMDFQAADVTDPSQVQTALESTRQDSRLIYFGLPPEVFEPAIRALSKNELLKQSRLILEKPFGNNLESAARLNHLLHQKLPETAVFRVDHFLEKHFARNLLAHRFGNHFWEPIWNHHYIQSVSIVWEEIRTVEGRAGYYDSTGALKDMIQNHLLQLACLIGLERPGTFDEKDLRDRKVEFLRSIPSLTSDTVKHETIRARYGPGKIGGHSIPAYVGKQRVESDRNTETFAQVTMRPRSARWEGVPFVLRTGKAFPETRKEIIVRFRPLDKHPFGSTDTIHQNTIIFNLDQNRVDMTINVNGPHEPFQLEESRMTLQLDSQALPAYAHLLLDALQGDQTLFIRADEAEEAWRIVDSIVEKWNKEEVPLLEYPAGTPGPQIGKENIPVT